MPSSESNSSAFSACYIHQISQGLCYETKSASASESDNESENALKMR